MERVDGYAAIRDYAVIGDGRTCALVARDGAIDWLCLPNVDSPSTFARLLDAERGGAFELSPVEPFEEEQAYLDGTNVLQTTFRTASGTVRVTDAMTLTDVVSIAPMREIVRKVEALEGRVRIRWQVTPRFGYGRRETKVGRRSGRPFLFAGRDAIAVSAWDAGTIGLGDRAVGSEFELDPGQDALISLAATYKEPAVLSGRDDVERRLNRTERFWKEWGGRARYDGRWREQVVRSALMLKLLVFAPSGAIVAAPTASLPEAYGGGRNWDYRYSWIRDASWTLDAMLRLGYRDEATAFFWWIMHASRITQPRLQILYRVDGGLHAKETTLAEFPGYRGSRPVRVGNGAVDQVQLDVYGSLFEAASLYVEAGCHIDPDTGKELGKIADYVAKHWRDKDSGIWEVRSDPAHFTQSKALCWVALDRAARLAERGILPDRRDRWRAEADAIRAFVEEEGWDEELRSYVRASDQPEVDGCLLTMALLDYPPSSGERMQLLIDAVRRELADGPLVYRYRGDDGVEGKEGAFLTCSFWLADALARAGRVDEAIELMDELLGLGNHVGLFPEEMDPATRDYLGNYPQGLTHLALVNAAISITDAER
ncbi:MAG TPA: glycoside hydrolase family 15 protein [Gaiellaceae bacterium]